MKINKIKYSFYSHNSCTNLNLSLLEYYAVLVGDFLPTRRTAGALQVSVIIFVTRLRHSIIKISALRFPTCGKY